MPSTSSQGSQHTPLSLWPAVGHRLQAKKLRPGEPENTTSPRRVKARIRTVEFLRLPHLRRVHCEWPNLACSRSPARSTSWSVRQDRLPDHVEFPGQDGRPGLQPRVVGQFPAGQFRNPGQFGSRRRPLQQQTPVLQGGLGKSPLGTAADLHARPAAGRRPRAARSTGTAAPSRGSVCGQRPACTPCPASACPPGSRGPGRTSSCSCPIRADIGRRGQAVGESWW